jgi:hypothetical protein
VKFVDNIKDILGKRAGKHVRPIDAMDMICATGEMVVAGNVRRSAIIILGDPWDKEYLVSKRWDLNQIPTYRAFANLSVVVDDIDDVHKLFWKTYENGEPFGIVNRKNIQKFGRIQGVQGIITGKVVSVTRSGEDTKVRVSLRAFEVETGRQLWGNEATETTHHNRTTMEQVKQFAESPQAKRYGWIALGVIVGLFVLFRIMKGFGAAARPR